ncbi:hypothetical protein AB4Z46_19655 [Variovorax sp. M-6]|uniref:hypothetical protein n=1 Tax=Variovorax sp. M-6 TaxID=3233041 RepID=UPI003F9CCC17
MTPTRFWRPAAALAILGVFSSAQALTNPPIRIAQGIEYMCGGKSSAEASFMETVAPRWAATLEFAVSRGKPGQFPSDVKVVVRERYSGRLVMETATGAPIMLARLDPGAYEVEATLAGITLQQPLTVFNGLSSKAVFVWPSNVDFAAALGFPRPEQQASVR